MGAQDNWGKKGATTAQEAELEQKGEGTDEGEKRLWLLKSIGKDTYLLLGIVSTSGSDGNQKSNKKHVL